MCRRNSTSFSRAFRASIGSSGGASSFSTSTSSSDSAAAFFFFSDLGLAGFSFAFFSVVVGVLVVSLSLVVLGVFAACQYSLVKCSRTSEMLTFSGSSSSLSASFLRFLDDFFGAASTSSISTSSSILASDLRFFLSLLAAFSAAFAAFSSSSA